MGQHFSWSSNLCFETMCPLFVVFSTCILYVKFPWSTITVSVVDLYLNESIKINTYALINTIEYKPNHLNLTDSFID